MTIAEEIERLTKPGVQLDPMMKDFAFKWVDATAALEQRRLDVTKRWKFLFHVLRSAEAVPYSGRPMGR